MSAWLPIETAPKDGTRIVLAAYSEYHGGWLFHVNHWRKYLHDDGEGWGSAAAVNTPTHWMPEPPKGER